MRNGGHPERRPARKPRSRHAPNGAVPPPRDGAAPSSRQPYVPHVVEFLPILRERVAHTHSAPDGINCAKCGSTFIVREPAFIHCRYCGSMHRIPAGSLLAQEEFELRSGLRLAS